MKRTSAFSCCSIWPVCVLLVAWHVAGAVADGEGFTDVTAESGVGQVVAEHYAKVPKWWLSGMDLVDLDGDGHLDLVLGAHGQEGVMAMNDGRGHFRAVEATGLALTEIHLACDIDEDRRLDFQMTYTDGGGRWFLSDAKQAGLHFLPTKPLPGQARENALIDLNRDGLVDWLHEEGSGVQVEFGDGHGAFTRRQMIATGMRETSAWPVDLNGDGSIDLVLKQCGYNSEKSGMCGLLVNDGSMRFSNVTEASGLKEEGLVVQGVGDVNQDGALDLICLDHGKTVEIYLNDGAGHFTRLPEAVSGMEKAHRPSYANWGLAVMTDFDNDGVADIVMNGRNFLYVLRGTGGGHFAYMNDTWGVANAAWAAVDEGICFGDVDGDGDLDLIGCGGQENKKAITVYRNDLRSQHWVDVRLVGAPGNRCAAGAKIRVLEPGTGKLLWYEQVVIAGRQSAHSYYATSATERHFGLGERRKVDLAVEFYPSGKVVKMGAVEGDRAVEVGERGESGE